MPFTKQISQVFNKDQESYLSIHIELRMPLQIFKIELLIKLRTSWFCRVRIQKDDSTRRSKA